jgi:toxin YoeB
MEYILEFSAQAQADIDFFKKSGNVSVLKKLFVLLKEITETPCIGTGKPEMLKHKLSGCWSRRINKEHRLIYEITGNRIFIHSTKGHYL